MRVIKLFNISGWIFIVLLLSACSSKIPPEIKQHPEGSPNIAQVRQQMENYLSQKVRWGGVILKTENKQNGSKLTIIAAPLSEQGKPLNADQSPGRFIAIVDRFLEPQLYSPDREITVTGQLLPGETQKVGEFAYNYPVVKVDHYYLWPVTPATNNADDLPYWWHDPFYPWPHPYYPYYPYYPHHHRH